MRGLTRWPQLLEILKQVADENHEGRDLC
jgi:hypothetical protein